MVFFFSILLLSISFFNLSAEEINWYQMENESRDRLEANPDDAVARFELAISKANLGKVEESYDQFDILGENQEENRELVEKELETGEEKNEILELNYRAFIAVVDEEYTESIKYFEKLIEREPENVWLYNYKAGSYFELDDLEKTTEILDKALEIQDNPYSHILYGLVHLENGHYIRAINSFNRSGKMSRLLEEVL